MNLESKSASEAAPHRAEGRVSAFLSALPSAKKVLILPHDNPDPDALASAFALSKLVKHKLHKSALIGLGGIIGRSENRALVSNLDIPLKSVEHIFPQFRGPIILVDTQPGRANNSLPEHIIPTAVIDHHPDWGNNGSVPFVDLREHYGATSTLVTEYLEQAELPLEPSVATALFYGISSETQNLGRDTKPTDIMAAQYLYPYVNKRLLSAIEHPPLPRGYFHLISQAVQNAALYDDVVVTILESTFYPDAVAELADFLLRMETARWSVCLAPYKNFLYVSMRSSDPTAKAGLLLASLLPSGMAGGHDLIAGGKIKTSRRKWKEEAYRITQGVLNAVGKPGIRPQPLVPKQQSDTPSTEILSQLLTLSPREAEHTEDV